MDEVVFLPVSHTASARCEMGSQTALISSSVQMQVPSNEGRVDEVVQRVQVESSVQE